MSSPQELPKLFCLDINSGNRAAGVFRDSNIRSRINIVPGDRLIDFNLNFIVI